MKKNIFLSRILEFTPVSNVPPIVEDELLVSWIGRMADRNVLPIEVFYKITNY